MVAITNKLVNGSSVPIWCCYSAKNPDGGYDIWKVRLLNPGQRSEWDIDIDYISVDNPNMTLNNKKGWWKLGQGGSFWIAPSTANTKDLRIVVIGAGLKFWQPLRYYTDWATSSGDSPQEIQNYLDEWEKAKDRTAPLE